jgi:hypothetical protein
MSIHSELIFRDESACEKLPLYLRPDACGISALEPAMKTRLEGINCLLSDILACGVARGPGPLKIVAP